MEDIKIKQTRIDIEATTEMTLDALHQTVKAIRALPGITKAELTHVEGSPEFIPFEQELQRLINRHSRENGSNTPDFLLASYLKDCLETWNRCVRARDAWYGIEPKPGWDPPGTEPQ